MRSGGTLSKRVARGGAIVGVSFVTEEIFRFARTLVLARMLSPTDFGLMGIAAIGISTLETFSRTGFDQALIQRKGSAEDYLDTAWVVSIARGILLTGMLYLLSPSVAAFFRNQEAIPVVRALSLVFLLDGLRNVGVVLFQKELAFGRDAVLRQTQVVAEFIVAVWLAFRLGNVWAIVYGMLAGSMIGLLVSYAIQPYRPRLIFEAQKAKELFDFGRYVWGYMVIIFLITQGDDALVGRVLGTAALGFYSLAYKISNFPATGITHVISRVTFPAYSKLQDNLLTLRRSYLEVLQLTAFISLPVAGGVFSLAPGITRILLGEKWMLLVPAMQVLALAGAARSVSATTGPLFQALGRPEVLTKLVAGRLAILAIVIYPLTLYFGIFGSSLAVFLSALAIDPISFYMAMKLTEGDMAALGKSIIVPFASTIVMVLAIFAAKTRLIGQGQIGGLFSAIALGAMVYLIVSYILDRTFSTGLLSNMRARLASL